MSLYSLYIFLIKDLIYYKSFYHECKNIDTDILFHGIIQIIRYKIGYNKLLKSILHNMNLHIILTNVYSAIICVSITSRFRVFIVCKIINFIFIFILIVG